MHIGIDLDNTIICYDGVFHRIAVQDGFIPAETPTDKTSVRNAMHATGLRDEWTELQGRVYGSRLDEARLFPGVRETLETWKRAGHRLSVVSHKTRYPYLGKKVDLHQAARDWLRAQALPVDAVLFMETLEGKVAAIAEAGCEAFVDDLPEVLEKLSCPMRVWFASAGACPDGTHRAESWREVAAWIS
jgi:uncharacterized HAD superfamily protein